MSGYGFCCQPANPGWGVQMCFFVCVLCPYPSHSGWSLRCVCSGTGFGFAPPMLAWVSGVCVWVRASLSPRQSWLGCWAVHLCLRALPIPRQSWLGSATCVLVRLLTSHRQSWLGSVVCVFGYWFCFQPANPGWGIGVCVFVCALCLYPASPCWGLIVFGLVQVLASPRASWLGFVVCVFG